MSKATAQNVIDLGFDKAQFGTHADDAAFAVYVTAILDEVSLDVADRVTTAIYAASTSGTLAFSRLVIAEKYFSAAELWRRIENFERRAGRKSRSDSGSETISSRPLKNADAAEDQAWAQLKHFGISHEDGSASIATGYIETGPLSASV